MPNNALTTDEIVQEDRDAADRLWMEMTGNWPKDLCEEDALTMGLLAQAFARLRTLAREQGRREASAHLKERAGYLRTSAGRRQMQWHENDAEMVANELDRQATAIRRLLEG